MPCLPSPRPLPGRAVVIVVVVLFLASSLAFTGRPASVILQILAGSALIGTEAVRRLESHIPAA